MGQQVNRIRLALGLALTILLCGGCDGVADIVFGSLRLALGIVDVAT